MWSPHLERTNHFLSTRTCLRNDRSNHHFFGFQFGWWSYASFSCSQSITIPITSSCTTLVYPTSSTYRCSLKMDKRFISLFLVLYCCGIAQSSDDNTTFGSAEWSDDSSPALDTRMLKCRDCCRKKMGMDYYSSCKENAYVARMCFVNVRYENGGWTADLDRQKTLVHCWFVGSQIVHLTVKWYTSMYCQSWIENLTIFMYLLNIARG